MTCVRHKSDSSQPRGGAVRPTPRRVGLLSPAHRLRPRSRPTSPGASAIFGSRAQPTPGGVPVRIRSPGSSVKTFERTRRGMGRRRSGRRVFPFCSTSPFSRCTTRSPLAVAELRTGTSSVAERAERVEALRPRPLVLRVLDVSRRHVVRAAVPAHDARARAPRGSVGRRRRSRPQSSASASTCVDSGGRTIASPGPIRVFVELAEEQRLGGRLVTELGARAPRSFALRK